MLGYEVNINRFKEVRKKKYTLNYTLSVGFVKDKDVKIPKAEVLFRTPSLGNPGEPAHYVVFFHGDEIVFIGEEVLAKAEVENLLDVKHYSRHITQVRSEIAKLLEVLEDEGIIKTYESYDNLTELLLNTNLNTAEPQLH